MNPRFVGLEMAKEITEAYYFQNYFFFTNGGHMRSTLEGDPFGVGVKPTDHIRHFKVDVKMSSWPSDMHDHESKVLVAIHKDLQILSTLKKKDCVSVRFSLETKYDKQPTLEDERGMYNLLETLRHPVYDLMHAGSTIFIEHWNGQTDFQDDNGYQSLVSGSRDKIFFDRTAEEWREVRTDLSEGLRQPHMLTITKSRNQVHIQSGTQRDISCLRRTLAGMRRSFEISSGSGGEGTMRWIDSSIFLITTILMTITKMMGVTTIDHGDVKLGGAQVYLGMCRDVGSL